MSRGVILTICPSGAGTARWIRGVLVEKLPAVRSMDVVPVSVLDDVKDAAARLGGRLRLIVGSVDPGIERVPFVSADEVLTEPGLDRINALVKERSVLDDSVSPPTMHASRDEVLSLLACRTRSLVTSVSSEEVRRCCESLIRRLEGDFYGRRMPIDLVVRAYLHAACMVERLSLGDSLAMPIWGEDLRTEREREYGLLSLILEDCFSDTGVAVPPAEVCYFLVTLPPSAPTPQSLSL